MQRDKPDDFSSSLQNGQNKIAIKLQKHSVSVTMVDSFLYKINNLYYFQSIIYQLINQFMNGVLQKQHNANSKQCPWSVSLLLTAKVKRFFILSPSGKPFVNHRLTARGLM